MGGPDASRVALGCALPAAEPMMRLEAMGPVASVLVLGIGNPSRGDDALGPLLIERLARDQAAGALADVELLTDFQLQPEHVLDLRGRARIVIADAAAGGADRFVFRLLEPAEEPLGHSTHSTSPAGLLRIHARLYGPPPPSALLLIRGYRFALGAAPHPAALRNLDAAYCWLRGDLDADARRSADGPSVQPGR
jgi:hydrogenase maturation protease